MTEKDPVPEADRLEQEEDGEPAGRPARHGSAEASDADVFEQELPLAGSAVDEGVDAERSEPVDDGEPTTRG